MIRTQVYFPDDLYHELKLLAAMGEGKFSDLVRQGAEKLLKEKKTFQKGKFDPWKDFVGVGGRGGPKDLSSNLDYYLYVEPYERKKTSRKK